MTKRKLFKTVAPD